MFKCNNEATANAIAQENNALFGMSVFDGKWYIGDEKQLKGIGVADIQKPTGDYVVLKAR